MHSVPPSNQRAGGKYAFQCSRASLGTSGAKPPSRATDDAGQIVGRRRGDVAAGTSFHILAARGLGRPVVSQGVTASATDLITDWDLQTNSMWFPEVGQ
jgi:hypothetical protein